MSAARKAKRQAAAFEAANSAQAAAPRRPPQQKRSAGTEDRLLNAALRVLDRDSLQAATVPRIAAEAGLSPGSIYRRFADKDDLLRLALLRMLDLSNARNAAQLRSLPVGDTLQSTAEALIAILGKQGREHPHLLRALNRLLEDAPDAPFVAEVKQRLTLHCTQAADVLLAYRKDIRHPDPERAARFAVLAATSAIELASLDRHSLWGAALLLSEKEFARELTRQMVAYLRRKP